MNIILSLKERYPNSIRKYEVGDYIAREGDVCSTISILLNGNIKISSITSNGNEILYKQLSRGDIFGNNLAFSNSPLYKGDVIVEENSTLLVFDKEEFMDLLSESKDFLESYLMYQSEDAKKLNQNVKLLSMNNAEDRLFYLLKHNKNGLKYKNISSLALQLGLTREVTSRLVHRLEKDGRIQIKDKTIIKA